MLLNINRNHNRELMEACRDLKDYAEYVDRVRKYVRELPLSEAVERAITECIRKGILKEFLEKNRAEVKTIPEGRESINLVEVSICSLAEVDQKTAYQAFMF